DCTDFKNVQELVRSLLVSVEVLENLGDQLVRVIPHRVVEHLLFRWKVEIQSRPRHACRFRDIGHRDAPVAMPGKYSQRFLKNQIAFLFSNPGHLDDYRNPLKNDRGSCFAAPAGEPQPIQIPDSTFLAIRRIDKCEISVYTACRQKICANQGCSMSNEF